MLPPLLRLVFTSTNDIILLTLKAKAENSATFDILLSAIIWICLFIVLSNERETITKWWTFNGIVINRITQGILTVKNNWVNVGTEAFEAAVFSFRHCFLRATLSSVLFNLLQLVLSACVAAVKCRPVLHHCVVIFFWSSGIIDCMFVYIW